MNLKAAGIAIPLLLAAGGALDDLEEAVTGPAGTCDYRAQSSTCMEYAGLHVIAGSEFTPESVRLACGQQEGTYVASCPDEGLVGICRTDLGSGAGSLLHMYEPVYDATRAEQSCAMANGEFTAP